MPTTSEKLTMLKHLSALGTRTKAELDALNVKIENLVTVGGQPNVIEEVWVNGVKVNPTDKKVQLTIATKVSELENDSKFQSDVEVQALISAAVEALKIGDYAKAADLTAAVDRIAAIEADYLKGADKTELQGNIDGVSGKVTTLIGEDTGKSVRAIAAEELAAQLVADGAKESLDTLEEIAAWIQAHPDDASAMNEAIVALQNKVDTGDKTVSAFVNDAIAALSIGDYAKAADLTALAGRVKAIEDDYLKGEHKTALEKAISDGDAATLASAKTYAEEKATAAETAAKGYADGLAGNYDPKGSAAAAETAAKGYADGLAKNYDSVGSAAQALVDAKAYADGLAGNYDAAGSAATAESNAKAYVDGMIATDEEVNAALTAIFGAQA